MLVAIRSYRHVSSTLEIRKTMRGRVSSRATFAMRDRYKIVDVVTEATLVDDLYSMEIARRRIAREGWQEQQAIPESQPQEGLFDGQD